MKSRHTFLLRYATLPLVVLLTSCTRVDVPTFTSVECSADPVGPPVDDPKEIEELATLIRSFSGRWKPLDGGPQKTGLAVVLKRESHAVAQIVIGSDWMTIQAADDRGPLMTSPPYEKKITAAESAQLSGLAKKRPNSDANGPERP